MRIKGYETAASKQSLEKQEIYNHQENGNVELVSSRTQKTDFSGEIQSFSRGNCWM